MTDEAACSKGQKVSKVSCHLCGATLRLLHQFVTLPRPGHDPLVICTNETRCSERMMRFDPVRGENQQSREERAARAREAREIRARARPE